MATLEHRAADPIEVLERHGVTSVPMRDDEALLQDFEGSQRRKARIAMVVVALVFAGFVGLKLYKSYLASELQANTVLTPSR